MSKALSEFKSKHNPDPEVVHLRDQVRLLRKRYDEEREAHGELREKLADLRLAVEEAKPIKMIYKPEKGAGSPCTHVLQLTDLHYGEVTKKAEIEGINEYSPEIAERRIRQLVQSIIKRPKRNAVGTTSRTFTSSEPRITSLGTFTRS